MTDAPPWSHRVRAGEAARGLALELEADDAARARLARTFALHEVRSLTARARLSAWLDGVKLEARWRAEVTYTCGISLEPFDDALAGEFTAHLVPAGSPHLPDPEAEVSVDPESPDPPEAYEGDMVDVADLVAQHMSVEIDPFPRKPGAVFEPPPEPAEPSPFAALAALKPKG